MGAQALAQSPYFTFGRCSLIPGLMAAHWLRRAISFSLAMVQIPTETATAKGETTTQTNGKTTDQE